MKHERIWTASDMAYVLGISRPAVVDTCDLQGGTYQSQYWSARKGTVYFSTQYVASLAKKRGPEAVKRMKEVMSEWERNVT
jgi:hypothetical protein